MRIVHVLHSHGYGGAENHALVLMKGQRAAGHDVMYAGPLDSWLGRACQAQGIPCQHLRMSGLFDLASHFTLRRLVRQWRADIVHGHLVRGAQYAGLAGHRHTAPIAVCTAHATTAHKHMGRCAHVIAVSRAVQDNLLKHGHAAERTSVIYNGMPEGPQGEPGALRAELGIPEGQFAVVNVGRFIRDKGQDLLVQAWSQLSDPRVHLYLVGDPATAFGQEVQALPQQRERIHYLGYRNDVQRILPAFDAYALSSRREALGLSVIEAFAASLPVIATAVGGVPEIVVADQTGWLVPPDNPDALTDAITRLAQAPETASQLARAGRAFYLEHLTDTRMVEQTLAVYEHCLAATHP